MGSVLLLGTLILAALAWWLVERRRKGRSQAQASPAERPEESGIPPFAGGSLSDRLIASSELIRTALIERFGPSWAGKTTEELSEDHPLIDWLGPEQAEAVLTLLAAADRAKFDLGGGESNALDPKLISDWESLATQVREKEAPPEEG